MIQNTRHALDFYYLEPDKTFTIPFKDDTYYTPTIQNAFAQDHALSFNDNTTGYTFNLRNVTAIIETGCNQSSSVGSKQTQTITVVFNDRCPDLTITIPYDQTTHLISSFDRKNFSSKPKLLEFSNDTTTLLVNTAKISSIIATLN